MAGYFGGGAGRYMTQDTQQAVTNPGAVQDAAPGPELPYGSAMAYQPNYSMFYNPRAMLQAGQPSFDNPQWYSSTTEAAAPVPEAPTQEQGLYDMWGPWQSTPGVNVMAMPPQQRILYMNMLNDPQRFQEMGGHEALGMASPQYRNRMLAARASSPFLRGRLGYYD